MSFVVCCPAGHVVNPNLDLTCCTPLGTLLLSHYMVDPVFGLLRAAMLQRIRACHIEQLAGHVLPDTINAFSDSELAQQRTLCRPTWRLLGLMPLLLQPLAINSACCSLYGIFELQQHLPNLASGLHQIFLGCIRFFCCLTRACDLHLCCWRNAQSAT